MPVTDNFADLAQATVATTTPTTPGRVATTLATTAINTACKPCNLSTNEAKVTTKEHPTPRLETTEQKSIGNLKTTDSVTPLKTELSTLQQEDNKKNVLAEKNLTLKSPLPPMSSPVPESLNLWRTASESPSLPKINIHFQLYTKSSTTKTSEYKDTKDRCPTPIVSASVQGGATSHKTSNICDSPVISIVRKSSDALLPRKVSFPKSDNELVTGYLEPANPWVHACMVKSISEIIDLYVISCQKHNTKPLQNILDHLKSVELNKQTRQPLLSLKSISLTPGDCEALEEIFKRVQYKSIDLSSCDLSECAVSALFEMIEYYEATNELDISSNPKGMTYRGWISCSYLISHSQELIALNARGNPISKTSAENLGNALTTGNLHTLKLEHCGLKGQPLSGLCFKLRKNRVLRELWLAHNDLDCHDASTLADLLKVNHYLELIDISNNNIRDDGLRNIVNALIMQSRELERRSMLQRSSAIDDDDTFSSVENLDDVELSTTRATTPGNQKAITCETCKIDITKTVSSSTIEEDSDDSFTLITKSDVSEKLNDSMTVTLSKANQLASTAEENEVDDITEDITVRSSTGTVKNGAQQTTGGKSMLDKLLSMNSDSSSEEGVSQLSTDTLAACCSEETSLINDDIFNAEGMATNNLSTNNKMDESFSSRSAQNVISSTLETIMGDAKQSQMSSGDNKLFSDIVKSEPLEQNAQTKVNVENGEKHKTLLLMHAEGKTLRNTAIFEVTAAESDCVFSGISGRGGNGEHNEIVLPHSTTRALDVNTKNSKLCEDYEDTHSTDSAFESASEGDISRHLPEEFNNNNNERLSTSMETTTLDVMAKELAIEPATIASESTESLVKAIEREEKEKETAALTPSATPTAHTPPTPPVLATTVSPFVANIKTETQKPSNDDEVTVPKLSISHPPKVTIVEDQALLIKHKGVSISPSPTPPPPSTSPGGASSGLRRTDSSCAFITQSTRNRSQSSDSLCSDNSLEGSISSDSNYSVSAQLNEKLTKNDTLTRQQRQNADASSESTTKSPNGLKALAVWSNNLTKDAGLIISDLLAETTSLELLNIGKNCLSNEFITKIKENLMKNTTLTTLGLQSAHLSAKGIETLASILSFGGNSTLQRIDIRDNKLEVESLNTLAEALKSNTTVMQIDIDDEPKRLSVGSDAHMDYKRVLENVRSMCSRNEKTQAQLQADKAANISGLKRNGGYYMGSRKISLTCYSRPLIDTTLANASVVTTPTTNKLEVKRKTGARLRSPVPSPPTVSPSSSPNRSRFQVFRVTEVSPLPSPLAQTPPTPPATESPTSISISVAAPSISVSCQSSPLVSTTLPLSSSFPSMASMTSSTQSIKRSNSPRSRFHVSKIYEDYPKLPNFRSPSEPALPTSSPCPSPTPLIPATTTTTPTTTTTNVPTVQNLTEMHATVPSKSDAKSFECPQIAMNMDDDYSRATSNKTPPITLTTLLYTSPLQPSSSSSSSTSPASSISNSSTTSSSSAYTTLESTSDSSDSWDTSITDLTASALPRNATALCPIVVFGDNDITLTKNSLGSAFPGKVADMLSADDTITQSSLQRTSKMSWLSNSEPIMQLRTLFQNPANINASSATNIFNTPSASEIENERKTLSPEHGDSITVSCAAEQQHSPEKSRKNLVLTQNQSPPSWYKLGTDILSKPTNHSDTVNTAVTNAAMATLEPARSFIDAASRQLRDFGKQMFQQNLSFGNNDLNQSTPIPSGNAEIKAASDENEEEDVAYGSTEQESKTLLLPTEPQEELESQQLKPTPPSPPPLLELNVKGEEDEERMLQKDEILHIASSNASVDIGSETDGILQKVKHMNEYMEESKKFITVAAADSGGSAATVTATNLSESSGHTI